MYGRTFIALTGKVWGDKVPEYDPPYSECGVSITSRRSLLACAVRISEIIQFVCRSICKRASTTTRPTCIPETIILTTASSCARNSGAWWTSQSAMRRTFSGTGSSMLAAAAGIAALATSARCVSPMSHSLNVRAIVRPWSIPSALPSRRVSRLSAPPSLPITRSASPSIVG